MPAGESSPMVEAKLPTARPSVSPKTSGNRRESLSSRRLGKEVSPNPKTAANGGNKSRAHIQEQVKGRLQNLAASLDNIKVSSSGINLMCFYCISVSASFVV